MDNELERLLTPRQVAEIEGCSITSVYARLAAEVGGTPDSLGHGELAQLVRFCRQVSVR